MARDGYVVLPGLLDSDEMRATAAEIEQTLGAYWSDPELDPGSKDAFAAVAAVQTLESYHRLAFHRRLLEVIRSLLGRELLVHTKTVRVMPRSWRSPAHQDYPFTQGATDTLTAWMPLVDCPRERGGLEIVPGSHRSGLRPLAEPGFASRDAPDDDPLIDEDEWHSADYRLGDVVLFHSLTMHRSGRNRTGQVRVSVDFRYQSAAEPVCVTQLRPCQIPAATPLEEITAGWSSRRWLEYPEGLRMVERVEPREGTADFTRYLYLPPSRFVSPSASSSSCPA